MKTFLFTAIVLMTSVFAHAQGEQTPIVEKEFEYKNWTFKKIDGGGEIDLRKFVAGKKLVLVVYFAPWCGNWRFEAPIVQRLYEKYKADGFEVIGVGEYDTVEAVKSDIAFKKLTFPVVYESDSRESKMKTTHYEYRKKVGDNRNWGSPFNVFLIPADLIKDGDTIARKLKVAAGELIETEAEAFIREKLGMPKVEKTNEAATKKPAEVCDPNATVLKKPVM
ncbi:MAG: TlpA family protein disulfide reductase [Acidobacteria bacterium]|nr:TlpA family protein disulfide reductase [Acidobacteriota bacterium]